MAKTFQLTANLNLKGPYGLASVTAQLRKQLGNVPINLQVNLSNQAINQVRSTNSYLGQLNKTLKELNINARLVTNAMNALAKSIGNVGQASQALNGLATKVTAVTKATSKGSASLEQFGAASALAVKRFAAYTVAAGSIYAVTRAFTSGIKEAFEFQREMVRVSQVTGKTLASLGGLSKEITRLSTTFGVSSKELSQVTTTLAQAGLSFNDVKTSLEALAKSSLSPTFGKIADTTEVAIAAMAQFKIEAKDLEKTLGSINSVAAAFAVESDDLGVVIRRSGGAFKAAGGELNELLALFTSVRATTRESAESIATGFRTIFTRLQRKDTVDLLKDFGIELRDLKGQFVGPLDAIQKLSTALNSIQSTDPRFSQIVEELGGFRQVSKVIPLIQQFALTQKALGVAEEGAGSLARDATTAQQALLVQVTKVKEEFADLFRTIANDAAIQGLVKAFLSLSSSLAGVSKTLVPLLPLFIGLGIAKGSAGAIKFGGGFRKGFLGFAGGGVVPGHGNSDSVPAQLTPGEFVINKKSAQAIGYDRLSDVNKYAKGGNVNVQIGGPKDYAGLFFRPEGKGDDLADLSIGFDSSKSVSGAQRSVIAQQLGLKGDQLSTFRGQFKQYYIGADGRQAFDHESKKHLDGALFNLSKVFNQGMPPDFQIKPQEFENFFESGAGKTVRGVLFENVLNLLATKSLKSEAQDDWDFGASVDKSFLGKLFGVEGLPKFLDAKFSATADARKSILKKAANTVPPLGVTRLSDVQNRADGGSITDTVPALLTPGEFVINKDAARKLGASTLNKMNKFALGGPVKLAFGGFGRKKPVNPGFPNLGDLMNPPNNVPITPSTAFPSLTDLYTQGASSAPTPRKFGGKFGAAATIGLTLGGSQVINSAFGTVSHDNTSSRAVTGSGLQGGLAGAAAGASIGSLFGPIGTVAGGAVGGLLGFTSALKQAEKEVKEIKLGKDLDALSNTLSEINAQGFTGVADIARGNASIGGLLDQRAGAESLEDLNKLDEGFRSAKQSISDFGQNIAKNVTTIEQFESVGSTVIQALSAIDNIPADQVKERFAKLIDAQNKTIEIQNKLNQVESVRVNIQQRAINIGNTLADVTNSNRDLSARTDRRGGGKFATTGFGDILSRPGNTFDTAGFAAAAKSTGGLFGGDSSALVESAVAFQKAASELPGIITRVASQPQLEGENVIQKLRDELKAANITGEIQSIIADGANAFGAGLDDFLDDALANPEKTAKKLLEGLDGVANTLAAADQTYGNVVNRFLSNIEASLQKQAALQQNLIKEDELELGKLRTIRGFNPDQAINVNESAAIFNRRQSALSGGIGNNRLGSALSAVQADIESTQKAIETARRGGDSDTVEKAGNRLRELEEQALGLKTALERLTDVAGRTADAQERLAQIEKSRSELRSLGEKLAFGSSKDLRQLSKDLTLTQIAGTQGLGAIPQNLRAGVGGLLGSLGSTNLKGLGGGTGNQIIDKLIQGLIGGELGGLLGNKPQAEETKLREGILQAFDEARKAQETLNKNEAGERVKFIQDMSAEFKTFVESLKSALQETEKRQLGGALGTARGQLARVVGQSNALDNLRSIVGGGDLNDEAVVARAKAGVSLVERRRAFNLKRRQVEDFLGSSFGNDISRNISLKSPSEQKAAVAGLPQDIQKKILELLEEFRSGDPRVLFKGKTSDRIRAFVEQDSSLATESADIDRDTKNFGALDVASLQRNFGSLNSSLEELAGVQINGLSGSINELSKTINDLQARISSLSSPPATKLAGGGNIFQPRGSDTVPAMLTPGEFVINARQAQANAGLLEEINNSNGPVYAAGGRPIRSRRGNVGGYYGPIVDTQSRAMAKAAARRRRLGTDIGYGGNSDGSSDSINDIRRARREQQISDRAERRLKRRFKDENFMEAAKAYGLAPSEKSSPEFGTPEFEQSLQERYGAYTEKRNRALRLNRIRANGRTREVPQIASAPIDKAPLFEGRGSGGLSFGSNVPNMSVAELQAQNRASNLLSAAPKRGYRKQTALADTLSSGLSAEQSFDSSLNNSLANRQKQAKLREELREKYRSRGEDAASIIGRHRNRYTGQLPYRPPSGLQYTNPRIEDSITAGLYNATRFILGNRLPELKGGYKRPRYVPEEKRGSRYSGGGKVRGYSRGGTVYRADGGSIGGGGMDTAAMSEFGQKMSSLTNALMMFSANADKLIDGLSKIPTEITMKGQHQLQVDITGAEAFNNMEDKFSKMITSKINEQLGKFINKYIPEAKQG